MAVTANMISTARSVSNEATIRPPTPKPDSITVHGTALANDRLRLKVRNTTLPCPRESARDALHQSECPAANMGMTTCRFHLHLQYDNEAGFCRWLRRAPPLLSTGTSACWRSICPKLSTQVFDFLSENIDRIWRDFLTNGFRGCLSHISEVVSPSPKDLERLPHASDRWGRGENTRNAIFDYLRISADVGSHYRPRTQHGFDYR